MKTLALALFCFIAAPAVGQDQDLQFYYTRARDAYRTKSYQQFYELIKKANEIHPYHQGVLYQLGLAAALTGHPGEALANLKKAILIDTGFKLEGISDFNSVKSSPEFLALIALQKESSMPVIHSDTAFVLKDRRLHAEGIAFNPATRSFYLGSIHQRKIIVRAADGSVRDFCPAGVDGMTSIFGIKADIPRNVLWACSSPMPEMSPYDSNARSAVYKFDLSTGEELAKFQRPRYEQDGVFGDLILNQKGEVFVSDSKNNIIFIVNEKTKQLEPYFTSPDFWNIQGLAFSENEKYLFIADYVKGIFRVTVSGKDMIAVDGPSDVSLKGVDGLNFYKNSLIAVQNGVVPARVTRYFLNSQQRQLNRVEILDRKHPAFNEPTMGVVANDVFYYIANSQWSGYDNEHRIKPEDQLQDIVILKANLKE